MSVRKTTQPTPQPTAIPTARATKTPSGGQFDKLLFEKANLQVFGIGLALIVLGFVLMSGGRMTDPNVWDESVIYSFRRITLAPFVVLCGLGTVIYSIFKK